MEKILCFWKNETSLRRLVPIACLICLFPFLGFTAKILWDYYGEFLPKSSVLTTRESIPVIKNFIETLSYSDFKFSKEETAIVETELKQGAASLSSDCYFESIEDNRGIYPPDERWSFIFDSNRNLKVIFVGSRFKIILTLSHQKSQWTIQDCGIVALKKGDLTVPLPSTGGFKELYNLQD